ncbi:hypothetical protein CMUS01_12488 [Colletotrichum musicola]|uniref:Ribonuclease H1 N-terminal domain-containing protein n=1 Tax=Colletotrichum musicola TaxID=2175873 RepID=A0A8H6JM58_9PEZI|nr:hypothetical protein CMUS01_12488 [Colletotrichum musicola]
MAKQRRKSASYYVVSKGAVERPTIFSSWYCFTYSNRLSGLTATRADAHARVTNCAAAQVKGFCTLEEARTYKNKDGIDTPTEVIKPIADDSTPRWDHYGYYAVAHGKKPGIYTCWYGQEGAEVQVKKVSGASYKWFKTEKEAEAFLEDWEQSRLAVRLGAGGKGLNQEPEPSPLDHDSQENMYAEAESKEAMGGLGLERLKVEE